jgi:DNA-directed RNA polymerase subunit omega
VEPFVDHLMEAVDSKYTMVIVAAKRARQLMGGARRRIETKSDKPVTVALEELAAGVLQYQRTKVGIK